VKRGRDPARNAATLRAGARWPATCSPPSPVTRAASSSRRDDRQRVDPGEGACAQDVVPRRACDRGGGDRGNPRAGVFEKAMPRSPPSIRPLIRGTTSSAQYGGRGICYLEFGRAQEVKVDAAFFGDRRSGETSDDLVREKAEFGSAPDQAVIRARVDGVRCRRAPARARPPRGVDATPAKPWGSS
jgi:hypothetical protein